MMSDKFDVAVIGTGPGGSVTSTILAMKGYRVVMIDREKFPRFHVGESLLPATQAIWEKIGIAERLQHSGHTFKYAGEFRIGRYPNNPDDVLRTIGYFHNVPRADFNERPYAYQVERAVFDHQLQQNAVDHGVTLWEETSVTEVVLDANGKATGIKLRKKGESERVLDVDFVVDASGRRVLMGRQLDCVTLDPVIKTSAVFGHFRGVTRDPGYRQGFFNGYFIPNGWFWFIPLCHDIMSVGVVQNQPATDSWSNDPEEVIRSTLNRYQFIQKRFKNAVQVGRIRRLKDLAYETKTFCGDGWLSVGDANFFVDPLYSSGVQVAHSTGEYAADVVDDFLKGNRDMRAIRRYEKWILDYRKRVFRPMRCFYRCMRNYKTIAGYVKSTGNWFNHFDNWFLRRACCWGTGRFHRHYWAIAMMSWTGNLSAWLAPRIGLGGWPRYENFPNPDPPLDIPKAPELSTMSDHDAEHVPITVRIAQQMMKTAPSGNGNGQGQPMSGDNGHGLRAEPEPMAAR